MPIVFLLLFLGTETTDSAAVFLLLSLVSFGVGLVVGVLLLISLLLYRRRWHNRLRDRLATDGVTAGEVAWFKSELSAEERKTWEKLQQSNPLLADAFCETLAARLTATRIRARVRGEKLRIERQINRTRNIQGADTNSLIEELLADRAKLENLTKEATGRLAEAEARLQTIEAAANRTLSQVETDLMLQRLAVSQAQFPLALEIATLEQEAIQAINDTKIEEHSISDGAASALRGK